MRNEKCEAVVRVNGGGGGGDWKPGNMCNRDATGTVKGRHVCWVHLNAAMNPKRKEKLEFVRLGHEGAV